MGLMVILSTFRGNPHIQTTTKHTWNSNGSVRSILCESFYSREPSTRNTPMESNFHAVHLGDLTSMSQPRLVDIRRRLLHLPTIMIGEECFMVEVYQRQISVHQIVIFRTVEI